MFEDQNIKKTPQILKAYKELLFTTPGLGEYISGVIVLDDMVRESTKNGVPFVKMLQNRGIHCGVQVDFGLVPIWNPKSEYMTEGLDWLKDRCAEYKKLECKFAKWRAIFNIGEGIPSKAAIEINAKALAMYASICQSNGLVPIIELDILQNGDHSI